MYCAVKEHNFMIKVRMDFVSQGSTDLYTIWYISVAGTVDAFKNALPYQLIAKL